MGEITVSNYRPFYVKIYNDKRFLKWPPLKRWLFCCLITNPACKISGIFEIRPETLAYNTGMDLKDVVEKLDSFDTDTLEYDFNTDVVYLKNYFRYNSKSVIGNPRVIHKSLVSNAGLVPHANFWNDFENRYKDELQDLRKRVGDVSDNIDKTEPSKIVTNAAIEKSKNINSSATK